MSDSFLFVAPLMGALLALFAWAVLTVPPARTVPVRTRAASRKTPR